MVISGGGGVSHVMQIFVAQLSGNPATLRVKMGQAL